MSLKCGIVGLPNVGKSTLFNALTKAGIAADNYPFCTIEPNVGIVGVPDARLQPLADIAQPEKVIPAVVEFVDIVGLVAGASKGEGLGTLLDKVSAQLDQGKPLRALRLEKEELHLLKPLCLLTAKPALYVANVDDQGFANNPLLDQVRAYAAGKPAPVVAICAALEAEIADLPDEDKQVFLADLGLQEAGLARLVRAVYEVLGLQTYFTAGPKEVRAWTIHKGDTAPQAAGVIHTDFEHGFIRAEVIAYDDYLKYRGEQGAKEAGKMQLEGKDYVVQDGDVMRFRFNV